MKSFFEEQSYEELLSRINQLSPSTQPGWGKMDVAQMMHHCQKPLELALGRNTIKKPGLFLRMMVPLFKSALYNDKLWKQGMQTAPEYVVSDPKEFETEKNALLAVSADFHAERDRESWPRHPMFGNLTQEQWGKMQYKHLDHHLRQFGV